MRYKPQEDTWVWILMGYQSAKMFASLKCVYNLKNYVWSWLQWKQFLISAVFVFLCNQSHNRQLQTWCSAETARNEANTSSVTLLEAHRNTLQSLSLFNPSFIQSSKPCCAVSLTSTFTATVRVIWASNTEHSFMEMCFARSSSEDEKMFWFLQPRDLSSAPSPPSFEFFGTADLLLVNIFCAHSHSHQEVTYWFLVPPPHHNSYHNLAQGLTDSRFNTQWTFLFFYISLLDFLQLVPKKKSPLPDGFNTLINLQRKTESDKEKKRQGCMY